MSRNDSEAIGAHWGLIAAVFSVMAALLVFGSLSWRFSNEEVWKQVGPILGFAFAVFVLVSQMGALLLAGMAWPAKLARITVVLSLLFIAATVYQMFITARAFNAAGL